MALRATGRAGLTRFSLPKGCAGFRARARVRQGPGADVETGTAEACGESRLRATRPVPITVAAVSTRPGRRDRVARTLRDGAGTAWEHLRNGAVVVFGCVVLWFGTGQAAPAWRAAHADGVSGEVILTDVNCAGKGPCSRTGNFRSDDGAVNLVDVEIVGAGGRTGDGVPAFYEGDRTQVYGGGWRGMLESTLMVAAGLAVIAGGVLPLVEVLVLRRRPPTGRHARRV